jgi:hypothetical protein
MPDTEILVDVEDETIVKTDSKVESDFPSMGVDLLKRVNIKIAFFLLLLGSVIFSDVFIEQMPDKYQDGLCPNSTGTFIQLFTLVIGYIVIDLLSQGGIL